MHQCFQIQNQKLYVKCLELWRAVPVKIDNIHSHQL